MKTAMIITGLWLLITTATADEAIIITGDHDEVVLFAKNACSIERLIIVNSGNPEENIPLQSVPLNTSGSMLTAK